MAKELSKTLWRTLLPIALSAGVAVWLFKKDIDMETLRSIRLDGRVIAGLLLALFFAFGRDFGLSWRFHTIADGALSWKRSFRTDLMCAFTSAITPSVVGGSALAIFYLNLTPCFRYTYSISFIIAHFFVVPLLYILYTCFFQHFSVILALYSYLLPPLRRCHFDIQCLSIS